MLVYNLSKKELYYRGRPIAANGGSREYPDMKYVPTRDMKLQDDKVLAFGHLPSWWKFEQEAKAVAEAKKKAEAAAAQEAPAEVKKTLPAVQVTKVELEVEEDTKSDKPSASKDASKRR